MTLNNLPIQLTALLFSITFTTAVVAQTADSAKAAVAETAVIDKTESIDISNDESKKSSADIIVNDADSATIATTTDSDAGNQPTSDTQANITPCSQMSSYHKSVDGGKSTDHLSLDHKKESQTTANREMEKFQQMEKQWYQQRREAYKQNLQNRNRQMSTDAETRRNDYIKHMEQRREFFNKMNDQRRKDFEQRKTDRQQKMHQTRVHQTNTVSVSVKNV